MRAVAHNAASPGHTPCAAAEAAFAEAKAFLCSAEAQQMSESTSNASCTGGARS